MSVGRFVGRRALALMAIAALLVGACTTQPEDGRSEKPDSSSSADPPSPREQAETKLTAALGYLSTAPVLRYDGELDIGGEAVSADIRVSSDGVLSGVLDGAVRLRLLAVDDKTFVRTGKAFWEGLAGAGESQRRKASYLAERWVAIDPAPLGDPSARLRPAALADEIADAVEANGVSDVEPARLDGTKVSRMSAAGSTFYVTDERPHRIVRLIPAPGLLTGGPTAGLIGPSAATDTNLSVRPAADRTADDPEDGDTESDEGIDIGDLDVEDIEDFYDAVQDHTENLDNSADSRVRFDANATPSSVRPRDADLFVAEQLPREHAKLARVDVRFVSHLVRRRLP